MSKTHSDPCCCKHGCKCRVKNGQCWVCEAKLNRDAERCPFVANADVDTEINKALFVSGPEEYCEGW